MAGTLEVILAAERGHWVRTISRGGNDYSNLSDFECSCGERFISSSMTRRVDAPTLPQVHRAKIQADALRCFTFRRVTEVAQAAELPFGSAVQLPGGELAQKEGISEETPWITQSGQAVADEAVALTGTLILWTPEV